ncbi:MMPL family transporter [Rhodococcus sp. O3]|uniref:MMPL family transporter n=1 Tax=Rhodococcus sp. O3 TaxID=3404919 RepID=UPI003B684FC0
MATRTAIAAPRLLLGIWIAVVAMLGVFGAGVTSHLGAGGFVAATAESSVAAQQLEEVFDRGGMTLVFSVKARDGADSSAARDAGTRIAEGLAGDPRVTSVVSLWGDPELAIALRSTDGSTGLVVAGVRGGDNDGAANSRALADEYGGSTGDVEVDVAGEGMVYDWMSTQLEKDLRLAESIAVPITFVVLVFVFGSVVSALIPVAVGVATIVATAGILRALTLVTDVSIFALNLAASLSLALAIDYSLLIVNRYRHERAAGFGSADALVRTMSTAGRTVLFSGLIVGLSLSAMALFPLYFMRSFAYAGVAVVAFAVLVTMTVTPAIVSVLGDRLEMFAVQKSARQAAAERPVERTGWYRLTHRVMRNSAVVAASLVVLLLAVGAPILGIRLGYPDERVLAEDAPPRRAAEQLSADFTQSALAQTQIVLPEGASVRSELNTYAAELSSVDGVAAVLAPDGTYVDGVAIANGDPGAVAGRAAMMTIATSSDARDDLATMLADLRAVPAPAETLFHSKEQHDRDAVDGIMGTLPWALGLIALTTSVVLFVLTGSLLLPIKALVMNLLSLSAVFGFLVWVFQDGNLGGLGATGTGFLVAIVPVLMFCVAFGLSMDYEVFLLDRIREFWMASDRTRRSNEEAVARGLAHTGRVVTAAALLMAIVFAALGTSSVALMRMFGVGMALAVVLDATVVRVLLVPSFMKLMGRLNWWAPPPLARFHAKIQGWSHPETGDPGAGMSGGVASSGDGAVAKVP